MKFIDVNLIGDELQFSDGYSRHATSVEKEYFKIRKTLKAYVDNNEYRIVRWADLHRHSGYSLLDGCIKINDMAEKTEFAGALTDHGNMCGAMLFYNAMKKQHKFPILGEEFYCETIDGEKTGNHLIILAKTEEGYKNLVQLSSMAYKNIYYKPHISYDMLRTHSKGLICTSACIGGELPQLILNNNYEKAETLIKTFKDIFGDDYYIEIQRHHIDDENKVNPVLQVLAKKHNVKLVATTDSHYVNVEDFEAHEVLLCVSTKCKIDDANRLTFKGNGYHLHNADEMESLFGDIPEALDSTLEIMDKCSNFTVETGIYHLPKFPVPDNFQNEFEYMKKVAIDGFKQRYESLKTLSDDSDEEKKRKNKIKKEKWERFKFELSTIEKMGFAGYFLIVWDFLRFCHENNIPTGPGRGSGAGSIVLYCLRITDIDPVDYDLLFERFLNPDRISMPDIDSDISERQRDAVIDYVTKLYGEDRVAHIITFGTFAAKMAVRDVSKIFGYSPSEAGKITALIPSDPKMTIEKAMQTTEFKSLMESSDLNKKILKIAMVLEGLPRNRSIHACGICISDSKITDHIPEIIITDEDTNKSVVSTQYTDCEEVGVLKFDFLGLRTLDVIDDALEIINKELDVPMKQSDIPINDPKVYKFLSTGHTDGVFQFESPGMTDLLKKMFSDVKVRKDDENKGNEYFERLIAAVSLYRPGPIDEIPNYLKAMKSGNIKYDDNKLEPILKNTYGILTYQEQCMITVRELAGFTKGQSDKIRKGMAKKIRPILDEYGPYFIYGSEKYDTENPDDKKNIKGCIKNGIDKETAQKIWDKMEKFGKYAFNKSHATCYAQIGAKTAWLSCYYPIEYTAGILNSYLGKADRLSKYLCTCKARNVPLLPPNINESDIKFSIENAIINKKNSKSIRYGLSGIKGVGTVAAKSIMDERNANGKFQTLEDFIQRMSINGIDKGTIEALIYSGSLDCFAGTKKSKINAMDKIVSAVVAIRKVGELQMSMFDKADNDCFSIELNNFDEFTFDEIAAKEKEYLGYFINHPLDNFSDKIEKWKNKGMVDDMSEIFDQLNSDSSDDKRFKNGSTVRLTGMITKKEMKTSYNREKQKNSYVLILSLDDGVSSIKCVAFGNTAIKLDAQIKNNNVVYLLGKIKSDDFGISVIVDKCYVFKDEDKNNSGAA